MKLLRKLNDSLHYGILGDIIVPAIVSAIAAVVTTLIICNW